MCSIFLIVGYGIPKDMSEDLNYRIYLGVVFNTIFTWCVANDSWNPMIIFSGGKTDMYPPYRRSEAVEMRNVFRRLMKRPACVKQVKAWSLLTETMSLSTLDNFIYTKELLKRKNVKDEFVQVFGEFTRKQRLQRQAGHFFKQSLVTAIDFDQAGNRYLESSFIEKREREAYKLEHRVLIGRVPYIQYRQLFVRKIQYLREAGPDAHVDAVRRWWEEQLAAIAN